MILDRIVETKRSEVVDLYQKTSVSSLLNECRNLAQTRGFYTALHNGTTRFPVGVSLIAEVKKASPSKGIIRENFHPTEIANIYEQAGATALSVLTDQVYFQGSPDYLKKIRSCVSLPLLRKEFIIDEIQIAESRVIGADAILLIVAILEQPQLEAYLKMAKELGLDALVEVHDQEEAERALQAGATLIGVNNRDLRDFTVDLTTTARIASMLPDSITLVAESGISSTEDVLQVQRAGASAILVGESLMREENIQSALLRLMGERSE